MAQLSMPVTGALPRVGICAIDLPADGPSIRILEPPDVNGYIVAYDKHTWTAEQIDGWVRIYLGDYKLVEPATAGA